MNKPINISKKIGDGYLSLGSNKSKSSILLGLEDDMHSASLYLTKEEFQDLAGMFFQVSKQLSEINKEEEPEVVLIRLEITSRNIIATFAIDDIPIGIYYHIKDAYCSWGYVERNMSKYSKEMEKIEKLFKEYVGASSAYASFIQLEDMMKSRW